MRRIREGIITEKCRTLIEKVDGIFWESDLDLTFHFVSDQAERILGYRPSEWEGVKNFWADRLHPEDREKTLEFCLEQTRLLRPHSFEYRMIAADGRIVWLRDLVSVDDENGKPVGLRGIMLDITQLKETEIALKDSEERFRNLADAAFDGIAIHHQGKILVCNENLANMFGYSLNEMIGESVLKFAAPETADLVQERSQSQSVIAYEAIGLRKDGSKFWAELRGKCTTYKNETVRVVSIRDISERKELEERKSHLIAEEQRARQEAERLVRQRDEFLAIATHELKTPLTPIKMQLQMLKLFLDKQDLSGVPKIHLLREAMVQSEKEFQRLTQLIDNLLDVSRISAGRMVLIPKECDLSELVWAGLNRISAELEAANCILTTEISPDVKGFWDCQRLDQVVTNLLANAIRYGAGKPIVVRLSLDGDKAILMVKDHGIGIDREKQEAIFERFVRAAPAESYGGLGLGLYIAAEIVNAHKGRIYVESQKGKGATFFVELPLR